MIERQRSNHRKLSLRCLHSLLVVFTFLFNSRIFFLLVICWCWTTTTTAVNGCTRCCCYYCDMLNVSIIDFKINTVPGYCSLVNVHCDVVVAVETIVPIQLSDWAFRFEYCLAVRTELQQENNNKQNRKKRLNKIDNVNINFSGIFPKETKIDEVIFCSYHPQAFVQFSNCLVVLQHFDRTVRWKIHILYTSLNCQRCAYDLMYSSPSLYCILVNRCSCHENEYTIPANR